MSTNRPRRRLIVTNRLVDLLERPDDWTTRNHCIYIAPQLSRPDSAVASMIRWHCRQHDSASTSRCGQVAPATPSLASLGCIIASMTRHLHRVVAKSPRQHRREHYRQHDLASTSHRGKVAPAVPSSAWLGIYIALQPSRPGSAVASMTQQHWRQHDSSSTSRRGQITSATPSPIVLGSTVTSMTQHRRHTTAWS
jgi:hypothetical protein